MSRVNQPLNFEMITRSAASCWVFAITAAAAPVTIFEDTFDLDPGSPPRVWTETTSVLFPTGLVLEISSTGSAAFFDAKDFGFTMSINQAISTLGYENIMIEVEAFQSNTEYETVGPDSDVFSILVGGANVFQSKGIFTGVDGTAFVGAGTLAPQSTGTIILPAFADNRANFMLGISAGSTCEAEDFFISSVRVAGDLIAAVPEASSAFLLGSIALGFFFWQSRRRLHRRLI